MYKQPLRPDRLRQVPAQFSWVDNRLVREGHLRRATPDGLALYHEHNLIATHPRNYQRRQDLLIEDHQRALLTYKKNAKEQQALSRLLRLSPQAELFVQGLQNRNQV